MNRLLSVMLRTTDKSLFILERLTSGLRFRRYARRMLRALEIEAAPVCTPLMAVVSLIRDHRDSRDQPFGFVRRNSKWRRLLTTRRDDGRLWEVAVLFHLRDAFRSGDIWLRRAP